MTIFLCFAFAVLLVGILILLATQIDDDAPFWERLGIICLIVAMGFWAVPYIALSSVQQPAWLHYVQWVLMGYGWLTVLVRRLGVR